MVREEESLAGVLLRYRLGTFLVWLGIFTWAPFILLRLVGARPPFLWFLPFHLAGVLGGSRLRSAARRDLGLAAPARNVLHTAGHALIFLGVLAWVPYLYMKMVEGAPVDVMQYLPFHLAGVLGGVSVHILSYVRERARRRGT